MATGTLEEQVAEEQAEFEGGETVDDLAEHEEEVPPMQIPLEGFAESVTMTPGGARAQTASVSLRGGKLAVSGEFKKGDVVELYVRCRVADIQFPDTHDKYGEVIGCERKHVLKPIAVRRLAASE